MSRILIVSGNLKDWSKNSGGKERTATLAEALHNHDVTFFSFSWGQESINIKLPNGINQIQVGLDHRTLKKYKELIRGRAKANHDTAVELLKEDLGPVIKKIKQLASNSDLVILDHFSVSPLIESITDVPIIYNSHNAEIVMANQLYPENTEIITIVEKMERIAIKNSVATTYCSTEDIVKLENHYGKINNSFYVPNGSLMHEKIDIIKRLRSKNILFVGSSHMPNIIAAKKIINIARQMPDYNFLICGNAGHSLQYEEQPRNYKIMGHVEDELLDQLFKQSFAFINPMESGSGTHLKMMKALSYGIPIISSKVGARGFSDKEIEDSMLISESNEEFAKSITMLENKLLYSKISDNGYSNSKNYDWKIIKDNYANFVDSLLNEDVKTLIIPKENKKETILIYTIIRNRSSFVNKFYNQIKDIVNTFQDKYDFYLSIYENDSDDSTKEKIFRQDWSFLSGVSIVSENINTKYFESVKDGERVKNLALARNKAIEAGGFLDKSDYVMMIESDINFDISSVEKLLNFKNIEPDFHIASTISIRNRRLYDWWATRKQPEYIDKYPLEDGYKKKDYDKYYSTSNGICLYRSKPFRDGVRYHWTNTVTGEADCEMVVICQLFKQYGYDNVYILHNAEIYHEHN
jgi:hypothetical protein